MTSLPDVFEATVLGAIQGLTEFLPVSSSGHLVLFHAIFSGSSLSDQAALTFDIVVHLGTLLVTLVFLRDDFRRIISSVLTPGRVFTSLCHLGLVLFLGCLPAAILGFTIHSYIEEVFYSPRSVAFGFLITAFFLELAHRKTRGRRRGDLSESVAGSKNEQVLSWQLPSAGQALLIGFAQAVAIIPGVSRSGSTIAVGLALGLKAESAIRFSFLLSVPLILGANLLNIKDVSELESATLLLSGIGFLSAIVFGGFGLTFLVRLTKEFKLRGFAVYVTILAAMLLLVIPFLG